VSARVQWEGLDELRAQLRALPAELTQEASGIVTEAARRAKQDIQTSYPERTGNLRKGVSIGAATRVGRFGAGVVLKNNSKHAWLYENGTQARHTAIGANHESMPPGHIFLPIVIRQRRAMYVKLKELLVRHGLVVTGDE